MSDNAKSYFDRFSSQWSHHYRAGGGMTDRLGRFQAALGPRLQPGARVLDYGCGTGEIARGLTKTGYRVSAVDISTGMLEQAKNSAEAQDVEFRLLDNPPNLPFADSSFDAVVSSSVLEYVAQPLPLLAEFARVLVPGGHLLFTVPDPRHPVRQKEQRIARWSRCDMIYALLRLTRWESQHTYLRISCTRWHGEEWAAVLSTLGLDAKIPDQCDNPLMMIEAQRR